jgi:chromosome segregation ATPase
LIRKLNFKKIDIKAYLEVWGMQELEQHINRINQKLQHLLKNYQQLQKDNERQTKLLQTLQQDKLTAKEQVQNLQQQVYILKAATNTLSETDKNNFEKNIKQYIKEIDKCITFLSE